MIFIHHGGRGRHQGEHHAMRGGFGHHGRGFGGWGGREHSARGGGRQRRMFDGGELRLVLLKLIADEPRHGYDLIRQIEEMTGGAYAPSPGVVYPTVTLLDDMGFIAQQQSEGAKKAYAVTDAGTAELEANKELVETLIARLTSLGEEREKVDVKSVRRAMGNLREVLINRLSAGDFDDSVLHDVVALIDETAQKIERL
ncbi:MAG: PadR family transcriptional regulator [Pseudomonadota bacterium]